MRNKQYAELTSIIGLHNLPKGLEKEYESWKSDNGDTLFRHAFLNEVLRRFEIPSSVARPLWLALEEIESNEYLLQFSRFLVAAMCNSRWHGSNMDYNTMEPYCMHKGRDFYSFLLLLACVEPSIKRLRERNVPKEFYEAIPYRPMKNQFQKLIQYGDARIRDFPWDLNFYTCSIFQFDRFLFIPCKLEDPLRIFRDKCDAKTIALYKGGYSFRRDGQLNGTSGIWDEEDSFVSVFRNNDTDWIGTYINPAGFAEREPIRLPKEDWEMILTQGDTLLAIHVPAGPGYTPERLRNSIELALSFYDNYFPEIPIHGFWSESWLYDPRLAFELENKNSNILRIQHQLYIYPIESDGTMLRYELFNNKYGNEMPKETSLQRAAATWIEKGGHFSTMGMFILRGDVKNIGSCPYQTLEDQRIFRQLVENLIDRKG